MQDLHEKMIKEASTKREKFFTKLRLAIRIMRSDKFVLVLGKEMYTAEMEPFETITLLTSHSRNIAVAVVEDVLATEAVNRLVYH